MAHLHTRSQTRMAAVQTHAENRYRSATRGWSRLSLVAGRMSTHLHTPRSPGGRQSRRQPSATTRARAAPRSLHSLVALAVTKTANQRSSQSRHAARCVSAGDRVASRHALSAASTSAARWMRMPGTITAPPPLPSFDGEVVGRVPGLCLNVRQNSRCSHRKHCIAIVPSSWELL